MAAHDKFARGQLVLRRAKALDLRGRLVAGGDHLIGFQRQFAEGIGPRQKPKGLRQHQRHRQGQQRIKEPRMRRRHIFAQAENRAITRAARRTDLIRMPPENRAVRIDAITQRPRHQRHRQIIARQDQPQRLGDLAEQDAALLAHAKPLQIVTFEAACQRRPQIFNREQAEGIDPAAMFPKARQRFIKLPSRRLAAGRRARRHDHRQIPVVLIQPVLQDAAAIGVIEPSRRTHSERLPPAGARPADVARDVRRRSPCRRRCCATGH